MGGGGEGIEGQAGTIISSTFYERDRDEQRGPTATSAFTVINLHATLLLVSELVTECNSFYFTLARDERLHFSRVVRMGEKGRGGGLVKGPRGK